MDAAIEAMGNVNLFDIEQFVEDDYDFDGLQLLTVSPEVCRKLLEAAQPHLELDHKRLMERVLESARTGVSVWSEAVAEDEFGRGYKAGRARAYEEVIQEILAGETE